MKRNLLILWAMLTGVIFLSGCYTKFIEPVVRQEIYEQAESDTVIQENQSFDNYTFDSSSLNEYNMGYRDASRDFLNSNLWMGYSPNSRLFSPYRYGYYQNNSYFLGYYDPWSYDPFYDWDYYRYYSYYGGYYYPYYGYYSGGYHGHGSHWYNTGGGGSRETIAEGRDQKKAEWQAKETSVSRSRTSDTGSSSDFQTTISYMPSTFQASSTTSASGTKTVTTTVTGSGSQKARWTTKSATTGTTSNGEPVVGFQTTLVPAASQTTVIRQNTGSRTGTKTTYIKSSGSSRSSSNKKSSSRSKSSSSDNSSSTPSSSSSNSSSSGSSGSSSTPSSSTGSSTSSSGSSSSSSSSSGRSSSSSSSGSSRSSSSKASSDSSKNHK